MRRHPGSTAGGDLHIHVSEPRKPASEVDYGEALTWAEDADARPFLDRQGNLVVPMNCEKRFRWWTPDGQSVHAIIEELVGHGG